MACRDCSYMNLDDTNGYKCYCSYYRTYEDPDGTCSNFSSRSSGGCYLTTACMQSMPNFQDDCMELTTLRYFRDTYLKENHPEEIKVYYDVAPRIVENIYKQEKHQVIYHNLYERLILTTLEMIKENRLEEAYLKYKRVSLELKEKYLN